MMKDSGADDLVEAGREFARPLDGKAMYLEIVQRVPSLEVSRGAHARFTEIDARDTRPRPAHRMLGRLGCPAAGDQNGMVFPEGL